MRKWLALFSSFLCSIAFAQSVAFPGPGMPASTGITYAKWNPATQYTVPGDTATLSGGNLVFTIVNPGVGPGSAVWSTVGKSSSHWYWEVTATVGVASFFDIGVAGITSSMNGQGVGTDTLGWGYVGVNGKLRNNAIDAGAGATYTAGAIIGVELDMTVPQLKLYKNCVLQYTQALAAGTWYAAISEVSTGTTIMTTNFGASAFSCTVPTGANAGLY